jgi:hypothetical protein
MAVCKLDSIMAEIGLPENRDIEFQQNFLNRFKGTWEAH